MLKSPVRSGDEGRGVAMDGDINGAETPPRRRSRFGQATSARKQRRSLSANFPDVSPSNWPILEFLENPQSQATSTPSSEPQSQVFPVSEPQRRAPPVPLRRDRPANVNRDRLRELLASQSQSGTEGTSIPAAYLYRDPETSSAADLSVHCAPSSVAAVTRTRVAVRLRPPNQAERDQDQFESCVDVNEAQKTVDISRSFLNKKQYAFDTTFGDSASTQEIYDSLVSPLVQHVTEGYCSVFTAYGQSSTGKTYTLGSDADSVESGCILTACTDLLKFVMNFNRNDNRTRANLYLSIVELCKEEMRDLLVPDRSEANRGRIIGFEAHSHQVKGTSAHLIGNIDDCVALIRKGSKRRCKHKPLPAPSKPNSFISSSHLGHMLLKFVLEHVVDPDEGAEAGSNQRRCSSISFVELAGSEWRDLNPARCIHVSGGRSPEHVRQISHSLASLSAVVHARKRDRVQRGESKLCALLHDALAGKVYWSILITIGPSIDFLHETTTSLLFGKRAMLLESSPLWNHEPAILNVDEQAETRDISNNLSASGNGVILSRSLRETPKKHSGSAFGADQRKRTAQTESPKARRKITFQHNNRVRKEHPDIEFRKYVAQELETNEYLGNTDDPIDYDAMPVPAVGIASEKDDLHAWSPSPQKWPILKRFPDGHVTGRSLQDNIQSRPNAGVCSQGKTSTSGRNEKTAQGAQNDSREQSVTEVADLTALKLSVEDMVEVHEQRMALLENMPSAIVLQEMQTRPHISSLDSILKHVLNAPGGIPVLKGKVREALAILAADPVSAHEQVDESNVKNHADVTPENGLFLQVLQELLFDEHPLQPAEPTQVLLENVILDSNPSEPSEAQEMENFISRILGDKFPLHHVRRILCPSSSKILHNEGDTSIDERKANEEKYSHVLSGPTTAIADLHTARMSDALRGGIHRIHISAETSKSQPEILQRLDANLRHCQRQSSDLQTSRQEVVASAALCQLIAELAILYRRQTLILAQELGQASSMVRTLGDAFLEDQKRGQKNEEQWRKIWNDSMERTEQLETTCRLLSLEKVSQHKRKSPSAPRSTPPRALKSPPRSPLPPMETVEETSAYVAPIESLSSSHSSWQKPPLDPRVSPLQAPWDRSPQRALRNLSRSPQRAPRDLSRSPQRAPRDLLTMSDDLVNASTHKEGQLKRQLSGSKALESGLICDIRQGENTRVIRLLLALDLAIVGQEGSQTRLSFYETLRCDLAHAALLSPDNFSILKVGPESLVVEVEVCDKGLEQGERTVRDVFVNLVAQASDASSRLMKGKFTQHIVSLVEAHTVNNCSPVLQPFDSTAKQDQGSKKNQSETASEPASKPGPSTTICSPAIHVSDSTAKQDKGNKENQSQSAGSNTSKPDVSTTVGSWVTFMPEGDTGEPAVNKERQVVGAQTEGMGSKHLKRAKKFESALSVFGLGDVGCGVEDQQNLTIDGEVPAEEGGQMEVTRDRVHQRKNAGPQEHVSRPDALEVEVAESEKDVLSLPTVSPLSNSSPFSPGRTGEISVGILANQQNRNVTAQLEAIPLEGFRELGHASGSPSAKGSSKQVDKRAEEMLQVNESVNHEHLTAAKRVMSLSVRHTNSFWHSCRELFLDNRSGAAIRKALKSRAPLDSGKK